MQTIYQCQPFIKELSTYDIRVIDEHVYNKLNADMIEMLDATFNTDERFPHERISRTEFNCRKKINWATFDEYNQMRRKFTQYLKYVPVSTYLYDIRHLTDHVDVIITDVFVRQMYSMSALNYFLYKNVRDIQMFVGYLHANIITNIIETQQCIIYDDFIKRIHDNTQS